VLVLDTHVLLWAAAGTARLSLRAQREIAGQLRRRRVAVSAISFWEIALLEAKRRVRLNRQIDEWRHGLLREGLTEIAVDGRVLLAARELSGFHSDIVDRLIVATAMLAKAVLVTADHRLLMWTGEVERMNAEA
jgi:PIN domain nuclease of toxin-antitoxin system